MQVLWPKWNLAILMRVLRLRLLMESIVLKTHQVFYRWKNIKKRRNIIICLLFKWYTYIQILCTDVDCMMSPLQKHTPFAFSFQVSFSLWSELLFSPSVLHASLNVTHVTNRKRQTRVTVKQSHHHQRKEIHTVHICNLNASCSERSLLSRLSSLLNDHIRKV